MENSTVESTWGSRLRKNARKSSSMETTTGSQSSSVKNQLQSRTSSRPSNISHTRGTKMQLRVGNCKNGKLASGKGTENVVNQSASHLRGSMVNEDPVMTFGGDLFVSAERTDDRESSSSSEEEVIQKPTIQRGPRVVINQRVRPPALSSLDIQAQEVLRTSQATEKRRKIREKKKMEKHEASLPKNLRPSSFFPPKLRISSLVESGSVDREPLVEDEPDFICLKPLDRYSRHITRTTNRSQKESLEKTSNFSERVRRAMKDQVIRDDDRQSRRQLTERNMQELFGRDAPRPSTEVPHSRCIGTEYDAGGSFFDQNQDGFDEDSTVLNDQSLIRPVQISRESQVRTPTNVGLAKIEEIHSKYAETADTDPYASLY